jgi:integrase-like protein
VRPLKPHDLRHGVAMEVLEQHHDLEQVRALLGHARIDTTQIYASIRPPQIKRAVSFYEEQATRMLTDDDGTRTSLSVANGRSRNGRKTRGGDSGFEELSNVPKTREEKR